MAQDRVVPPAGFTVQLTVFAAGAMAFLAVFALALSLASGRLASSWSSSLARTATIRISTPEGQLAAQEAAALRVLATTPGIASFRKMTNEDHAALLAPWFGPDLPLDTLPLPGLIEIVEDDPGYDAGGLRLRLAAEAPGAVLDDHTRWRRPLVDAAARLQRFGVASLALIAVTTAAMVTLAAQVALAANAQVIRVLRLVGATDSFIARAFVRRFTLRSVAGAAGGTAAAMVSMAAMPDAATEGGFLNGIGFRGADWLLPLAIPILAGVVALVATWLAALRTLKGLT